jgi:hypothetical protein
MEFRRSLKVRPKKNLILKMDNRFRSVGIGESEIGYTYLYLN